MDDLGQADRIHSALRLIRLDALMNASRGSPAVVIGLIDGPVDLGHPAFAGASLSPASHPDLAMCRNASSGACVHGTAVAGVLCARRGVPAPAICPGCTTIVHPILSEDSSPAGQPPFTTAAQLSRAIIETVDAGAVIINLSLGVITSELRAFSELDAACDYARRRAVILVAASGNQGRIGFVPLLDHPWVIPVAACDIDGSITPESNISPSIGTRGLRAPGVDISTTSPASRYVPISGTSVAAAFVTGGLALLWSEFPHATAGEVRQLALQAASRAPRSIIPPLFDAEGARTLLRGLTNPREVIMEEATRHDEVAPAQQPESDAVRQRELAAPPTPRPRPVVPARGVAGRRHRVASQLDPGGSCPTCAVAAAHLPEAGAPPTFIYALGTVKTRFPSPSIEKEFVQCVAGGQTANLTDQQVLFNVIKENRHLANEMCWVFSVEGIDTYILVPRDAVMLDQFVDAVKPATRRTDIDVVIGIRGPMAPAEMCNGLVVPIVIVDQIYSFDTPTLLKAIPKPAGLKMTDEAFRSAAEELFDRIQQMADNAGATDEHRALNYLAVRYPAIYNHTSEMHARDFSLTTVDVIPSRLSGTRKLYDVIFSFTNRNTDVVEKYYVRVDVTEKYPYLDKRLSPFYDRQ